MQPYIDLHHKREILWPTAPTKSRLDLVWRIAHEHWGSKMNIVRPNMNTLLLGYVLEGRVQISDTATVSVEPNQVFLAGNTSHGTLRISGTSTKLYIIETHPLGNELAEAIWGSSWLRLIPVDAIRIRKLFERALNEATAQRLRCRQQTSLITQEILLALEEEHAERGVDLQRQCFEQCRQLIHDRFPTLRNATEVADACGYTTEHLTRLFRQYQNTGVYEYLISLKISACCQALTQTNKTVAAVADEFGFANPYSFSRTFTRIMGIRPGAYRQSH